MGIPGGVDKEDELKDVVNMIINGNFPSMQMEIRIQVLLLERTISNRIDLKQSLP